MDGHSKLPYFLRMHGSVSISCPVGQTLLIVLGSSENDCSYPSYRNLGNSDHLHRSTCHEGSVTPLSFKKPFSETSASRTTVLISNNQLAFLPFFLPSSVLLSVFHSLSEAQPPTNAIPKVARLGVPCSSIPEIWPATLGLMSLSVKVIQRRTCSGRSL